jgi:hypothetical protein
VNSLAEALDRFNRKERNLLIRAILGHGNERLCLSEGFRDSVTKTLKLTRPVPADAWWGTDYHINWLAAAIAIYLDGETALGKYRNRGHKPSLVEGNQQDIDLVIAAEPDLILIEAKAYGTYREQIEKKVNRLNLLHNFYEELRGQAPRPRDICFHLLLFSIDQADPGAGCPSWANENLKPSDKIPWIPLTLGRTRSSILQVTRCRDGGKRDAKGGYWRYLRMPVPRGAKSE